MAIALVAMGAITTSSTTTVAPAFAQATTAGHFLVARVGGNVGSNTISVTGTGWLSDPSATAGVGIFYKPNCGAGEAAPTFSQTSATYMAADLVEFSGVALTSPLDKTSTGGSASGPDSTTSDLAVIAWVDTNSKSTTYTVSTNWTPAGGTKVAEQNTGATKSTQCFVASAYLLNGAGGSVADSAGLSITPGSGSLVSVNANILTFLPAPPPDARPILTTLQAVMRASTW